MALVNRTGDKRHSWNLCAEALKGEGEWAGDSHMCTLAPKVLYTKPPEQGEREEVSPCVVGAGGSLEAAQC